MALLEIPHTLRVYVEMGGRKSRLAFPGDREVSGEFCSLFTVFAKHAGVAAVSAVTLPNADTWPLDKFKQAPSNWTERFELQAQTASRGQLR